MRPSFNYWHCRLIGGRYGCEPHRLSSIGPRRRATSGARAGCKFVSSRLLATIALVAASTVSTHAQTSNWTGEFSSDWFLGGNWNGGIPRQTIDANINTVTPNATVVASPGASAQNLAVGQNGTGMLTIQTGGTLTDSLRGGRQSTGRAGHGDGDRPGLQLDEYRNRRGRRPGHGHAYNSKRRHGDSSGGGSIGQSAGSTGTVTVTGPGSSWNNGPGGGLNIGSFGTGTLTIANGGRVINITAFPPTSAMVQARRYGDGDRRGLHLERQFGGEHWQLGHRHAHDCGRRHCHRAYCYDRGERRCDWNTQHRRGRGQSGGCARHAHGAERRIWRRHRYDQLQSHVRRLRVCACDQRQRHRQCARGHHNIHRCQHLQRTDECQRGHVAGRRAEHVQPKFGGDGRERRNARSQWLQPDRTRRHQCRPGEHGHGHRAGHGLDDDQLRRELAERSR